MIIVIKESRIDKVGEFNLEEINITVLSKYCFFFDLISFYFYFVITVYANLIRIQVLFEKDEVNLIFLVSYFKFFFFILAEICYRF